MVGGVFTFTSSEVLSILVGGRGMDGESEFALGPAGGGGTFVIGPGSTPLLIAGGGGGGPTDNGSP